MSTHIDLPTPSAKPLRWTFLYKPSSAFPGNVRVHISESDNCKTWYAARHLAATRLGCTIGDLTTLPTEGNPYVKDDESHEL